MSKKRLQVSYLSAHGLFSPVPQKRFNHTWKLPFVSLSSLIINFIAQCTFKGRSCWIDTLQQNRISTTRYIISQNWPSVPYMAGPVIGGPQVLLFMREGCAWLLRKVPIESELSDLRKKERIGSFWQLFWFLLSPQSVWGQYNRILLTSGFFKWKPTYWP